MLKWTKITQYARRTTLQAHGSSHQNYDDELALIAFFRGNCTINELENYIKLFNALSIRSLRYNS
jgi:hypothetical protein